MLEYANSAQGKERKYRIASLNFFKINNVIIAIPTAILQLISCPKYVMNLATSSGTSFKKF